MKEWHLFWTGTVVLETAAAGVPGMFVQAKPGHAQGSTHGAVPARGEDQLPRRR